MTTFLKGITWKDGVWAALAAILIFLNVRSCNSSKELLTVSSSSCDTIRITQIDSFIDWRIAPIPEPRIDTIVVEKIVERTVEIIVTDTFTELIPSYIKILDSIPIFVYDSVFETNNYKLRWHIESLGKLKVFHHALTFNYELRETKNLIQGDDSRKWLLMFSGIAQTDFSLPEANVDFYLGGEIFREWRRLALGLGYYNQVSKIEKGHMIKFSAGIRF